MQQFVISLYVLALTGSATIFASMLSISILLRIILSPMAGVFGDWFDRKNYSIIGLLKRFNHNWDICSNLYNQWKYIYSYDLYFKLFY